MRLTLRLDRSDRSTRSSVTHREWCRLAAPLVEARISIPEPELPHIMAEVCERHGAGHDKKPRQRLLTITAPRLFIVTHPRAA